MAVNPVWTDAFITELKYLIEEKLTAEDIAYKINDKFGTHFTKNSIVSASHRFKCIWPPKKGRKQKRRKVVTLLPVPQPKSIPRVKLEREPPPIPPINTFSHSIMALTKNTCKWPIGDPHEADFHYCMALTEAGLPYCNRHCSIAYTPRVRSLSASRPSYR